MLYFIPNGKALSTALLKQHGLDGLIASGQGRETMRGPTDGPGILIASGNVPMPHLTYDPAGQVWQRRFGSDAWVGYVKSDPPSSQTLQRDKTIRGESIILADGNAYCVPLLRSFDPNQLEGAFTYQINLDRVLEQDPETGRMVPGDVIPEYSEVWNQALQIGDCVLTQVTRGASGAATLEDGVLEDFVANVLAMNYRVHKPELSILKLLTVELSVQVMQMAIDWKTLQANLKNRLSRLRLSGSDTKSGATQPTVESTTKPTGRRSRR